MAHTDYRVTGTADVVTRTVVTTAVTVSDELTGQIFDADETRVILVTRYGPVEMRVSQRAIDRLRERAEEMHASGKW